MARRDPGRPSLLTPELIEKIVAKVLEGVPPKIAATENGVVIKNWYNWMAFAIRDIQLDEDSIFRELYEKVSKARGKYLSKIIARGDEILMKGPYTSVKDVVLWLERQDPEHFRKRESTEIVGRIETIQPTEHLTTPEEENERLGTTLAILEQMGRIPRLEAADETDPVIDAEAYEVRPAQTDSETDDLSESD